MSERLRWDPACLERGRFVEAVVHVPPSGALTLRYEWSDEGADVYRLAYLGPDVRPGASPLVFGPETARAMRRALAHVDAPSRFARSHLAAVDARIKVDELEELRYRLWRSGEAVLFELEVRSAGALTDPRQVIPLHVVPVLAAALTDFELERERLLREVRPA